MRTSHALHTQNRGDRDDAVEEGAETEILVQNSISIPTDGTIGSIVSNGLDVVRVATLTPGGLNRTLPWLSTLMISAKSVRRRRDQLNVRFARRSRRLYVGSRAVFRTSGSKYTAPLLAECPGIWKLLPMTHLPAKPARCGCADIAETMLVY